MVPAEFSIWKSSYSRWLKSLYFRFILCCYKFDLYTHIPWKRTQTYNAFCHMIYRASTKELPSLSSDDDDAEELKNFSV